MPKNNSRRVAVCGVLCALSVALLLAGNLLQIGTYAAPMLAAFLLVPVGLEYGRTWALLLYLSTALLSLMLVPDKELALFYALVLGYHPVLHTALANVRPAAVRWAAKLVCFNAALAAMYALLLAVFASPALAAEFADTGAPMLAALVVLGNLSFVLFDIALDKLALVYRLRLRQRLRRFW